MNKRDSRLKIINVLYQKELLDDDINLNKIFFNENLSKDEIEDILIINKKYNNLKQIILFNLSQEWNWIRIDPLVRSILILGSFELLFLDKRIVINEMVEISKYFIPDDAKYKFINGVLDNVEKTQKQIKDNTKKEIDNKE